MAQLDGGPATVLVMIGSADPHADRTDVRLCRLADGTTALPVFSDIGPLLAAGGPDQPWMLLPVERLGPLRAALGVDSVVVYSIVVDSVVVGPRPVLP